MDRESPAQFDVYAHRYDALLERSLAVTGENKEYFARGRLKWLAHCLADLQTSPTTILDFGCGTGSTTPIFLDLFEAAQVIGLDDSAELLEVAKREFADRRTTFLRPSEFPEHSAVDLVFCSSVFHHVLPHDRRRVAEWIHSRLAPGGLLALWEHNAWSPAARYVMSRCEFDRDAIPLSAREARHLLRETGFEILRTDFLFIVPRILRVFRPLELLLSKIPFGAQFQMLARKSGA